jgi:hypothetical protein
MPIIAETAEVHLTQNPDRLIMLVDGLRGNQARIIANNAARLGRQLAPKLTGRSASRMFPLYGYGYFGVGWSDPVTWYQESGVRPFLMRNLAGKTIPMWVDDPSGTERQKNPKAQTRTTLSGKTQVLIFRRAARFGQTRTVRKKVAGGTFVEKGVPMSYPGAPGRIGVRQAGQPWTTPGTRGGQIARGNIGIRWYYPGLAPRKFLNHAITQAAQQAGIRRCASTQRTAIGGPGSDDHSARSATWLHPDHQGARRPGGHQLLRGALRRGHAARVRLGGMAESASERAGRLGRLRACVPADSGH